MTAPLEGGPPPFVSIIVIVHHRTNFVQNAVTSALQQSPGGGPSELLVVANTLDLDLENRYRAASIHVVRSTAESLGEKVAEGIAQSKGEVICLLEDDDRFEPTKLMEVARRFRRDPELVFYHNQFSLIGPDERPFSGKFYRDSARLRMDRLRQISYRFGQGGKGWRAFAGVFPGFNNSSISIRRSVISPGFEFLHRIGLGVDEGLWYAAAASGGRLLQDNASLTRVMVHAASVSRPAGDDGRTNSAPMADYSHRTVGSWEILVELARESRDTELLHLAEGELAVQGLIALLRTHGTRGDFARQVVSSLRRLDSLATRNFPGALPLGMFGVFSPQFAKRMYLAIRRISA